MNNNPIGIFDSGLGGLTVVKAVRKVMPKESIIYFGDTARVPYGNKSPELIKSYSLQITDFLISHNAKIIIVACNTATALALEKLKTELNIPVLGVVKPGVQAALKVTKNNKIGVIGTLSTIGSDVYKNEILSNKNSIEVTSTPCPLFVPLAEEGWLNNPATKMIAEEYLARVKDANVDTLILGCTHYPLLTDIIQKVMTDKTHLVDSAHAMATFAAKELKKSNLLSDRKNIGELKLFVSDLPAKFETVANRFLGEKIKNVEKIHLDTI